MTDMRHRPATAPRLSTTRKLWLAAILVILIILTGVVGYKNLVPENTWLDAVYQTAITLSTVGFKEVHDLEPRAQIFTIALIAGGVVSLSLVLTLTAGLVVEGALSTEIGRRRMEKRVHKLANHHIICGYGRMGRAVADIFAAEKEQFVVVERDSERLEEIERHGHLVIHGDATQDEILTEAGVDRARSLVSVTASPAENLFITLSAREKNPDLQILARADDESTAGKLRRAGANRVVTPVVAGAFRLANAALRPAFIDFMEAMMGRGEDLGFRAEEIRVRPGSEMAGQSLKSLNLSQRVGAIIVAIMRKDGKMEFNPAGQTVIQADDVLVTVGTAEHFERIKAML
jgi:voltage-gated potassium channel